jgi:HK97 gp10 family phage protein
VRVELYPDWQQVVARAADPGIRRKAERVEERAKRTAPVRTGRYRDSIHLARIPDGHGWRVQADAPYSIYVEFGTRYMAAYHTLARALDAAKG